MTLVFAFLAGVLSILSPCVMPLLPLVLSAAASEHRYGPLALAAGLAFSFTGLGLVLATFGFAIGLGGVLRSAAAVCMIVVGLILLVHVAQIRLATIAGPVSNYFEQQFGRFSAAGLKGQFAVGLLLGAVWSPCVGPTLGAASLLAAQGKNLGVVAVTMMIFGIGAAVPMLLLGTLSRELLMRLRGKMMGIGGGARSALGVLLIFVGAAVLTGFDKTIESALVAASPHWLLTATSAF